MFSFITPYIKAIEIAAIVAILVGDFYFGYHYRALGEEKAIAVAEAAAIVKQQALDQDALNAAVADARAQAKIITVTRTIIQKVPTHVAKTDACPLSVSYVGLWNNGIAGADQANDTGQPNVSPAGVSAVDALNNLIINAGICNANAQQLTDLQTLLRQQGAVK